MGNLLSAILSFFGFKQAPTDDSTPTGGSTQTGGSKPTGGSTPTGGSKPTGGSTQTGGSKPPGVDLITNITGSFGMYQLGLCFIIFLTKIPIACHQMAIIFLGPKVKYTCNNGETTNPCPCSNPVYDKSVFKNTIVMEFGLICDKKWMASMTQTLFQFGTLIGSVLFGMASDRYGRKKPFLVAIVIQVSVGIGAAFIKEYWTFTFLRFLIGTSVGGTMVIGFVIIMEFVGTKYRDVTSALYQLPFNFGHLLLPVIGYFIREWSNFQLAISVPSVIMLSYFFLCPETPRWLIALHRTNEAIKILEKVAKCNKRPTENIRTDVEAFQAALEQNKLKKGSIIDLFRTPNIRKNILAMAYNWMACSYCFYGVSQYIGQLGGNVFINIACSAGVSMLGTLLSIPMLRLLGRKTILIMFNFIGGGCLLILAVVPEGLPSIILACIGTVSSFITFIVVYLYCSELFPTVLRNSAVGFSSMMARVGSMIAPFVVALRDNARWIPPVLFAVGPIVAGIVAFLMPETKGHKLMTTIAEGEAFGKKSRTEEPQQQPVTIKSSK